MAVAVAGDEAIGLAGALATLAASIPAAVALSQALRAMSAINVRVVAAVAIVCLAGLVLIGGARPSLFTVIAVPCIPGVILSVVVAIWPGAIHRPILRSYFSWCAAVAALSCALEAVWLFTRASLLV